MFDEDGGGTVDYQELIMGIEIFKYNTIEDKINCNFEFLKIKLAFINLVALDDN